MPENETNTALDGTAQSTIASTDEEQDLKKVLETEILDI